MQRAHKLMQRTLHPYTKATANKQNGFTLIEMAIVLVIIGFAIGSASLLYRQHIVKKNWQEGESKIENISTTLGNFRAVYGRYPCPSSATDVPSDVRYGFEYADDCVASAPAAGTCAGGVCAYDNGSGKTVLVGTLPYKVLNIREENAHDPFHSRYTYAVTLDQTNNLSFTMNGGGIGVVDSKNTSTSLIKPDDSAHFVIVSHGPDRAGAYSRTGQMGAACAIGTVAEQENCDGDTVFSSSRFSGKDFTDRVAFFSSVYPTEWQYSASAGYGESIHLKTTDSIAVGAPTSAILATASKTEIQQSATDAGSVYASDRYVSERLCEYGTTAAGDCFEPELIAGTLNNDGTALEARTNGEGMSCYDPLVPGSENLYMVGIANGQPICSDEIFATCASGRYISRIDPDGTVVCDALPGNWCPAKDVTTICRGNTVEIASTFNAGYSPAYSGECRMIDRSTNAYDGAYFGTKITSMADLQDARDLIDQINQTSRVVGDCESFTGDDWDTQIRESYKCNNGTWAASPIRDERQGYQTHNSFPSIGGQVAEFTDLSDDLYTLNGNSGFNSSNHHDCWCREDFKVLTERCSDNGVAYNTDENWIEIWRHPCPQTFSTWQRIYQTGHFCRCTADTIYTDSNTTCNSYYQELTGTPTSGLSGNVLKHYNVVCDLGTGVSTRDTDPYDVDTSSCACRTATPSVSKTSCPANETNSWVWGWNSQTQTGKVKACVTKWDCPSTTIPNGYGGTIPNPATYDTTCSASHACACVSGGEIEETALCPDGKEGSIVTTKTYNCAIGDYEVTDVDNDCHSCTWRSPTDTVENTIAAKGSLTVVGTECSCGAINAEFCVSNNIRSNGEYALWSNCQCIVQND